MPIPIKTSFSLPLAAVLTAAMLPSIGAAAVDVPQTLKGIENRYNSTKSLQANFAETYTFRGRKRTERGVLYLRKPGRMRWQYTSPAGKLFISDGDFVYYYSPQENRAEKTKLKGTDDLRAPLAFLLGKLDFQRDFGEFIAKPEGADVVITAIPKSGKLPYTQVSFVTGPDYTIKRLSVQGQDGSAYDYVFENEKVNAPVADALFRFTPPPGAQYVDSTRDGQ
ncbi:MAG TPA: outer membrane lipoprotein chaperone LolA [Bryobacteraceae bacterium]|nr:outer membrane lipoprotein chaperone LolA [Bryobacteraceae bacterium]